MEGKMEGKINAIYCRESTKAQARDGYNLLEQEKKCKSFVELEEYEERVEVYSDYGQSAKNLNRKEIKRMFDDIKKGLICRIIVYKLDRIVRRLTSLNELLILLKEFDVNFVSVKEKIDTETAMGRMFLNLVVLFAEWEQDTISERTIEGMLGGAKIGNYILGGKVPFGYERFKNRKTVKIGNDYKEIKRVCLVKKKEESELVLEIFKLAIEGYSVFQIAIMINNSIYMKKMNKKFYDTNIRKILKNKVYYGVLHFRNEVYNLDIDHIIKIKDYELANTMIKKRSKTRINDYIFKNKVYCKCGDLCLQESSKKVKIGGVERYLYYHCKNCNKRINERNINDYFITIMIDEYKDYKKNEDIIKMKKELKKILLLRERLYKMYKKSQINEETFIEQLKYFEKDYKKIKIVYSKYLNDFENYFISLSETEKAKLVTQKVKKIIVDMDFKIPIKIEERK